MVLSTTTVPVRRHPRNKHCSLLLFVKQFLSLTGLIEWTKEKISNMDCTPEKFKKPQLTGLVLYHHPNNFYSQKVLFALYEKKIEFTSYVIDLFNGEQYSQWFLALNPKGDVPVLEDDCFIIPNSSEIINYLEQKYRGDPWFRLKPKEVLKKIAFYEHILNRLPIGAITLGSFIHNDLKLNPKPPFIGPFRKTFIENSERISYMLKISATQPNSGTSALFNKISLHEKRWRIVNNREDFQKLLDGVEACLAFVENELVKCNNGWLVSTDFTSADISLGLLLYRLHTLGFENYFWSDGKLPHVEQYFKLFQTRESFKKFVPTSLSILKEMWLKAPSNYKIGAGAGVLGMAMFAASAFAHK